MKPKILGAPEFIALGSLGDGEEERAWFEPEEWLRPMTKLFKLRRASKPRPGDAFLVLGDIEHEGDVRFEDLTEVTWASAAVYGGDLCYRPVRWK